MERIANGKCTKEFREEAVSAGQRVDDIARDLGLSSRQIWNILGTEPEVEDNRQLKLFK